MPFQEILKNVKSDAVSGRAQLIKDSDTPFAKTTSSGNGEVLIEQEPDLADTGKMYEAFYGLTEKPFSILPDPDFIYWGETHSLAYTMLEYGILNRAGFTVITGEIGCGKTTLIRHLLNELDEEIAVGLVSNTQKDRNTQEDRVELLHWVLMAFDQPFEGKPYVALYDQFQQFLISEYAKNKRTVLIIDEAQNLGPRALEELRMFSNINADKDQLLQLVLLGQPELRKLLQKPELIQFAQRISSDFHLNPLNLKETKDYIAHRLKIAGREEPLFTIAAINDIFDATGGVPRLINILCDTVLVYGFSMGAQKITAAVVDEVLRDRAKRGVIFHHKPRAAEIQRMPTSTQGPEPEKSDLARHGSAAINILPLSKTLKKD